MPGQGACWQFRGQVAHGYRAAQVDAGGDEFRGGPRREEPLQVAARDDRLNLRGAGGDDDLPLRMDVKHSPRGVRGDDQRSRVDARDLLPLAGVQRDDVEARVPRLPRGFPTRVALPDDDRVAVDVVCGRRAFRRPVRGCEPLQTGCAGVFSGIERDAAKRRARLVPQQGRRLAAEVLARHRHAVSCPRLAGTRVGHAVDRHQAVRAVAAAAQAAAAGRVQAGAQQGDQKVVARFGLDWPSIHLQMGHRPRCYAGRRRMRLRRDRVAATISARLAPLSRHETVGETV